MSDVGGEGGGKYLQQAAQGEPCDEDEKEGPALAQARCVGVAQPADERLEEDADDRGGQKDHGRQPMRHL